MTIIIEYISTRAYKMKLEACILPALAMVGSRPSAVGTLIAALKFWTLSLVLKLAI